MTDAQKIEKLAEWAGFYVVEIEKLDGGLLRPHVVIDGFRHAWNPLFGIVSARRLLPKLKGAGLVTAFLSALAKGRSGKRGYFELSDAEAARAISEAVGQAARLWGESE